jgi:hypothetical protein
MKHVPRLPAYHPACLPSLDQSLSESAVIDQPSLEFSATRRVRFRKHTKRSENLSFFLCFPL